MLEIFCAARPLEMTLMLRVFRGHRDLAEAEDRAGVVGHARDEGLDLLAAAGREGRVARVVKAREQRRFNRRFNIQSLRRVTVWGYQTYTGRVNPTVQFRV